MIYNLCSVEFSALFIEPFDVLEMLEKFTTAHELSDEENLLGGLEGVFQVDEEGVVAILQDNA